MTLQSIYPIRLLHPHNLKMYWRRGKGKVKERREVGEDDDTVRTMCGSRIGGWSLPGVMSDGQRCVDWFLAKYCRCTLWLDSCWCT
jgi:hypothetical protein